MGSLFKSTKAIDLLKQDHRAVEALFERYEQADEGERVALAQDICQALTVHAHVEEELFYPALRGRIESDLLDEAEVEHQSLKELIAKLDGAQESDELFGAYVKVLQEYVKHHVKEEEHELMPKAKDSKVDLEQLGDRMEALKAQLESKIAELSADPGGRVRVLQVDGRGVRHPERSASRPS